MSTETGQTEIYVQQFPEGPARQQVSIEGGVYPRWRGDGRELYYFDGTEVWAAAIEIDGESLQPGVPRPLFSVAGNPSSNVIFGAHPDYHRFAVSTDGERFLISRPAVGGTDVSGGIDAQIVAIADEGNANVATGDPNTVVLNWQQMLEER